MSVFLRPSSRGMFEQHEGVPSEHDARLRRRDVECEEGQCGPRPGRARALLNGCSPSVQFSPVFLSKITPVLTAFFDFAVLFNERWWRQRGGKRIVAAFIDVACKFACRHASKN